MTDEKDENTLSSLGSVLQKALDKNPIDISKVLDLATEIAKGDPENVRFFVDAGLIQRLGYELVSRQETAVSELVKNSYDADATIVDLIFFNTDRVGGTLEIRDNGIGMTRAELIDGFMRLSSISKVREPISPRFKRQRAGRKGIGRFAVQRLGRKLTVTTKTKSSNKALQVIIDWDQFTGGKELSSIANRIEEVAPIQIEGTTLFIENLRDTWSEAEMKRVWRYVADLLQPFPLSKISSGLQSDSVFRADIYKQMGNDLITIADKDTQIFEYALAEISASINESGRGQWSLKSKQFPQVNENSPIGSDSDDPSKPFKILRNINIKAYYYIYQAGLLPPMMDGVIRRIAGESGGIRLYRNGFRVLPYGEAGNDWLRLEEAYARRRILVPIANHNFFGFVEINDPEGIQFEETASREGLIENPAFEELVSFCFRVLRAAVLRFATVRDRKGLSKGRESQLEVPPQEKVQKAITELQEMFDSEIANSDPVLREEFNDKFEQIKQDLEQYNEETKSLIDELGLMRVLASLGIVIGEFTHEVKGTLTAASINARDLANDNGIPDSLKNIVKSLQIQLDRVDTYAQYFDRTVSENANRDRIARDLRKIIKSFIREHKDSALRKSIVIEDDIHGYQLLTRPMHGAEIDAILFNFYSNSVKAIRRKGIREGKIMITAGRSGNHVFFEFSDNGIGIPDDNKSKIFNAFFTTSTSGLSEDDDLRGSGLGLKIVKDIVTAYGGHVFLISPPPNFATCFRVEILSDEQ